MCTAPRNVCSPLKYTAANDDDNNNIKLRTYDDDGARAALPNNVYCYYFFLSFFSRRLLFLFAFDSALLPPAAAKLILGRENLSCLGTAARMPVHVFTHKASLPTGIRRRCARGGGRNEIKQMPLANNNRANPTQDRRG